MTTVTYSLSDLQLDKNTFYTTEMNLVTSAILTYLYDIVIDDDFLSIIKDGLINSVKISNSDTEFLYTYSIDLYSAIDSLKNNPNVTINIDLSSYEIYLYPGDTLTFACNPSANITASCAVNWTEEI